MKSIIFILVFNISYALADFVQLSHGQTAFFGANQIMCSSPQNDGNNCFVQKLKGNKFGIVLPDNSVITRGKGFAVLAEMERLHSAGECSDFHRFTIARKQVMPAGTILKFKQRHYRCPSSEVVTRKNCKLINKKSNFQIVTPGGLVFNGGAFETTKIKINRLMKMNICNDVTEL